eukprot:2260076-Ditylum_brightwellii.AAC.1
MEDLLGAHVQDFLKDDLRARLRHTQLLGADHGRIMYYVCAGHIVGAIDIGSTDIAACDALG